MKQRTQPETLRLRKILPTLVVNDLQASRDWYRNVMGFIVVHEMVHEDQLRDVYLRAGTVELLITQDDFAKGRDRPKGQAFRLYCTTGQDLDELARAIEARGGVLAQQPTDQPWGARDFAVVDPDGFNISITTSPEES